ncbi:MAG: acylphosphatase [Thermodesulfobacteriota bacterium]|nr:acylphosphatase [Thermodesulfobacteriota bacterium]
MSEKIQYHLIVHGRVQGVFFRAETCRAAKNLNITGWVKNLADGTVEAVIEGKEKDVQQMLAWCKKGSPLSSVNKIELKKNSSISGFTKFETKL